MAITTRWYTVDNKVGVNLNAVVTSVTLSANPAQPEYPGLPHNLGDRVQGNNGSEWMFVRASVTVTAFNMVQIGRDYGAINLTHQTAAAYSNTFTYGVAEFQVRGSVTVGNANGGVANAGEFFWALMKANGGARVNISSSVSVATGAALYIHQTIPGQLSTTAPATGGAEVVGVALQVSVIGADNSVPSAGEVAFFTYPFPGSLVSVQAVSI